MRISTRRDPGPPPHFSKATRHLPRRDAGKIRAVDRKNPGLKKLTVTLNERMSAAHGHSLPKDYYVIGGAHVDSNKYVTALKGHRDNLETQIFWAGNWSSLPVNGETLSIFPSAKISSLSEISATPQHRTEWFCGNRQIAKAPPGKI